MPAGRVGDAVWDIVKWVNDTRFENRRARTGRERSETDMSDRWVRLSEQPAVP